MAGPDESCVICLTEPIERGFLHGDYLHFCVCNKCSHKISVGDPCPLCRASVERIINVFSTKATTTATTAVAAPEATVPAVAASPPMQHHALPPALRALLRPPPQGSPATESSSFPQPALSSPTPPESSPFPQLALSSTTLTASLPSPQPALSSTIPLSQSPVRKAADEQHGQQLQFEGLLFQGLLQQQYEEEKQEEEEEEEEEVHQLKGGKEARQQQLQGEQEVHQQEGEGRTQPRQEEEEEEEREGEVQHQRKDGQQQQQQQKLGGRDGQPQQGMQQQQSWQQGWRQGWWQWWQQQQRQRQQRRQQQQQQDSQCTQPVVITVEVVKFRIVTCWFLYSFVRYAGRLMLRSAVAGKVLNLRHRLCPSFLGRRQQQHTTQYRQQQHQQQQLRKPQQRRKQQCAPCSSAPSSATVRQRGHTQPGSTNRLKADEPRAKPRPGASTRTARRRIIIRVLPWFLVYSVIFIVCVVAALRLAAREPPQEFGSWEDDSRCMAGAECSPSSYEGYDNGAEPQYNESEYEDGFEDGYTVNGYDAEG